MAEISLINTSGLETQVASTSVDRMQQLFSMQRKSFERNPPCVGCFFETRRHRESGGDRFSN